MAHMNRIAALLGFAIAAGCLLPTLVSGADPTPPTPTPRHTVSQAAPGTGSGSSEPLGDRLDRTNGVIRPPTDVDPELTQPPPESSARTPIIPPPGTPGGKQDLNPK